MCNYILKPCKLSLTLIYYLAKTSLFNEELEHKTNITLSLFPQGPFNFNLILYNIMSSVLLKAIIVHI